MQPTPLHGCLASGTTPCLAVWAAACSPTTSSRSVGTRLLQAGVVATAASTHSFCAFRRAGTGLPETGPSWTACQSLVPHRLLLATRRQARQQATDTSTWTAWAHGSTGRIIWVASTPAYTRR